MNAVGGTVLASTVHLLQVLLTLLRLKLLLRELSLLVVNRLALHSSEEIVSLQVLGVIMADALFLHLPKFLQ